MRPIHSLMIAGAVFALAAGPAFAADPCAGGLGTAQIVNCLKPGNLQGANRGIRAPGATPAAGTASGAAAAAPEAAATVNLLVPFGFDSAELTDRGRHALDELGSALKDPALRSAHFEIAGHTDATGTAAYNMALSQRRADAARSYLVSHAGIDPARLTAVGFGATRLYDKAAPDAAINRRVQVSRIGS